MNPLVFDVLARARGVRMTRVEREAQKIDFAYGNARFENPLVTREMARRVYERLYGSPTGGLKHRLIDL